MGDVGSAFLLWQATGELKPSPAADQPGQPPRNIGYAPKLHEYRVDNLGRAAHKPEWLSDKPEWLSDKPGWRVKSDQALTRASWATGQLS